MTTLEIIFCVLCPFMLAATLALFCWACVWRALAEFWRRQYEDNENRYRDRRPDLAPCIRRAGLKNVKRV